MTKATRLARALAAGQKTDPPQAAPSPPADGDAAVRTALRAMRWQQLVDDLRLLSTREDGWLRLIPDTDRQIVHLKWKFTRGRWERYYVYVQIEDMRVPEGLSILLRKIHEVDNGERKPTLDKLYEES